jgi:hypothetical protein
MTLSITSDQLEQVIERAVDRAISKTMSGTCIVCPVPESMTRDHLAHAIGMIKDISGSNDFDHGVEEIRNNHKFTKLVRGANGAAKEFWRFFDDWREGRVQRKKYLLLILGAFVTAFAGGFVGIVWMGVRVTLIGG